MNILTEKEIALNESMNELEDIHYKKRNLKYALDLEMISQDQFLELMDGLNDESIKKGE